MADKAPYKLTIKLDSARPDALGEGLARLREIASEYDQTGEGSASITIESFKESPLTAIMADFEEWLWQHKIGVGCEMKVARPGIRPEMVSVLRARHETPMDQAGWAKVEEVDAPLITPVPLQLPAAGETVEAEYTIGDGEEPVTPLELAEEEQQPTEEVEV